MEREAFHTSIGPRHVFGLDSDLTSYAADFLTVPTFILCSKPNLNQDLPAALSMPLEMTIHVVGALRVRFENFGQP